MRGCFSELGERLGVGAEFPAVAGVFLTEDLAKELLEGVPRGCGGVSVLDPTKHKKTASSPRLRGCFRKKKTAKGAAYEFPAVAGVFPSSPSCERRPVRVPRGCGGVSNPQGPSIHRRGSSPRLRGCFRATTRPAAARSEFPAVAGVFLTRRAPSVRRPRVPRGCGGVSRGPFLLEKASESSPRLRGCFPCVMRVSAMASEFPAVAGVFPRLARSGRKDHGVPRGCGGVSGEEIRACDQWASSPRLRGCFRASLAPPRSPSEFPAVAGVFLAPSHR